MDGSSAQSVNILETYCDSHFLPASLLIFQFRQPQNKRILRFNSQSGWQVDNNRWHYGAYRYNAYQYRISNIDFCTQKKFHFFWVLRSGKGEVNLYRFISKHSSDHYVLVACYTSPSILYHAWSCRWIILKNISLSTECAAAFLSFRYPGNNSFKVDDVGSDDKSIETI